MQKTEALFFINFFLVFIHLLIMVKSFIEISYAHITL